MTIIDRIDGDIVSSSAEKAALAWAELGVRILAVWGVENGVCDCGNPNCENVGKHPIGPAFPHGHKDATTNRAEIRRVFKKYPDANLAVVPPEGLVVLDVDGPTGAKTYRSLGLPETAHLKTGRGAHYYFRYEGSLPDRVPRLDGIDIKTGNGYLVTSPSDHTSGKRYRWNRSGPRRIATLPKDFFAAPESAPRTVNFSESTLRVGQGGRNSVLTSFAGFLRYRGLAESALERVLQALNGEVCTPPLSDGEVAKIAESVGRYEVGSEDAFLSLADIEEEDVQYLAYPYLVRGAANLLDGHMGQGKSTFTAALAAAVTTGKPPPFLTEIEQGNVLFLSAEDDAARALKPRLVANGADVSRIRFQNQPFTLDDKGMFLLRQEVEVHRPALVVIDPVIAYMDSDIDGNSANDTMRFIVKLDYLAREFDTCILLVRHFRKAKTDTPMHRGVGSIALAARVRSALMLGTHPEDGDLRLVAHAKANYSMQGPSIVFELASTGERKPSKVVWHDLRPDLSEYDIVDKPEGQRGRPSAERDFAKDFLHRSLQDGPMEKHKLVHMAEARGITPPTLRRAANELGVIKFRGESGRSMWRRPDAGDPPTKKDS
ncbi:bifunctional DNA primase/polymerase [Pelagibacterium halotolerans]|uniref:bifunctional DNA primase/polymerase n=1 Tax=Pelagibacterium halotolerans TaxID=531813 RepID=UPI00384B1129